MHMMMAFGFCMYCLWKNRNYLLHLPHCILHTHNTPAHFAYLVLAATCMHAPVITVCTGIHTVTWFECTVTWQTLTHTDDPWTIRLRWGPYTVREMGWELTVFPDWTLTLIWHSISVQRLRRSPPWWGHTPDTCGVGEYMVIYYITILKMNVRDIALHVHTINIIILQLPNSQRTGAEQIILVG